MDYIDRLSKKHKEHFSKDSIVAHLTKVESDLKFKQGLLISEIDELRHVNKELEFKLNRLTKADKYLRKEIKKERLYIQLTEQCEELISKCRRLEWDNDRLQFQNVNRNLK